MKLWVESMNNQQQQQQQEEYSMDSFVSPSFSSYTSDKLADIADQVNKDYFRGLEPQNDVVVDGTGFEFVAYGDVSPVFPIFNRDLMTVFESDDGGESKSRRSSAEEDVNVMDLGFSMRKLLIRNNDRNRNRNPSSSSSSSEDDLEEIPAGTYCVWTPNNSAKSSPSRDKRSKSAGSSPPSKPWKLLDLIRRSNSEGKDSVVLVTPTATSAKKKEAKGENLKKQRGLIVKVTGKHKVTPSTVAEAAGVGEKNKVSAHEAFYVRNRELSKVDKRRSFLPYRQELIAFSSF